jgi:hypothetical protein
MPPAGGMQAYLLWKGKRTMSLPSTCFSLLLIATCTYGQGQPLSRHITGTAGAASAQVMSRAVDTNTNNRMGLSSDGAPLAALRWSAADDSGWPPAPQHTVKQQRIPARRNDASYGRIQLRAIPP